MEESKEDVTDIQWREMTLARIGDVGPDPVDDLVRYHVTGRYKGQVWAFVIPMDPAVVESSGWRPDRDLPEIFKGWVWASDV